MIANGTFDDPGGDPPHPGLAAGWFDYSSASAEEVATFEGDIELRYQGYETFERGWTDENPARAAGAMGETEKARTETFSMWDTGQYLELAQISGALFSQPPAMRGFESFERGWQVTNAGYAFELMSVQTRPAELFYTWNDGGFTTEGTTFGAGPGARAAAEDFALRRKLLIVPQLDESLFSTSDVLYQDELVTLEVSQGELPSPLSTDTQYYVAQGVAGKFKVHTQLDWSTIVVWTDSGSGTMHAVPDPGRYWSDELGS